MSTLSTHLLDATLGVPARGVRTTLHNPDARLLATAETDADGRIRFDLELGAGTHRLTFATAAYFAADERPCFHPEVSVAFEIDRSREHVHVALLLSPYSYTTYRGS